MSITLNGHLVIPTKFPDGTSQVWLLPEKLFRGEVCQIEWRFENEAEFMHLAQLKTLCDSYKAISFLSVPYLPYARQDKGVSNTATFALYSFAGLLNTLKFSKVVCLDLHSWGTRWNIENLVSVFPRDEIMWAFACGNYDGFCYPDEGANTRYGELLGGRAIYGKKLRNQQTGKVSFSGVCGDFRGIKKTLIVDDICDGGATFIKLARLLKEEGVGTIGLYVTHGLFTKGTQILRDAGISEIYTYKGKHQ